MFECAAKACALLGRESLGKMTVRLEVLLHDAAFGVRELADHVRDLVRDDVAGFAPTAAAETMTASPAATAARQERTPILVPLCPQLKCVPRDFETLDTAANQKVGDGCWN